VHVWLLSPPTPHINEPDWWVLALTALNAMVRSRGAFVRGGIELVAAETRAFLDIAWLDFADSQ